MPTKKKTTTKRKAPAVRKKKVGRKKAVPRKKTAAKKAVTATTRSNPVEQQTLRLDSVVVINNAKSLYQSLADLDNNSDVTIDASAVEMIDTAVLQLLFAFTRRVQAGNHKITWESPSDEFISRADLLGLSPHLGIN